MKADYLIIPDIHGQVKQFDAVVQLIKESIQKDRNIHILFLGDYIDRGEGGNFKHYSKRFKKEVEIYYEDIGSRLVIERLFDLKDYFDEHNITHTFLRGNHEQEFIRNIQIAESGNNLIAILESKMNDLNRKTYQEMIYTLKGFTQEFDLMKKTKTFFESMPLYMYDRENELFFVHAGVEPGISPDGSGNDTYLWIREKFYMYTGTYPARIIFGHTPIGSLNEDEKSFLNVCEPENIILKEDRIGLDSGNYQRHPLNVLRIKDRIYELIKIDTHGVIASAMPLNL